MCLITKEVVIEEVVIIIVVNRIAPKIYLYLITLRALEYKLKSYKHKNFILDIDKIERVIRQFSFTQCSASGNFLKARISRGLRIGIATCLLGTVSDMHSKNILSISVRNLELMTGVKPVDMQIQILTIKFLSNVLSTNDYMKKHILENVDTNPKVRRDIKILK